MRLFGCPVHEDVPHGLCHAIVSPISCGFGGVQGAQKPLDGRWPSLNEVSKYVSGLGSLSVSLEAAQALQVTTIIL